MSLHNNHLGGGVVGNKYIPNPNQHQHQDNNNAIHVPNSLGDSARSSSSSSLQLPTHITDPFNLQEAISLGVVFAIFFFYLNVLFRNRFNSKLNNDEFGARIISFLHALVVSVLAGYALYAHDGGNWDSPATRFEGDVCMLSFAYFFVDAVVMILWKFDLKYFLHHIVALRWLSLTALFGQIGYGGAFGLLAAELSNPIMHGRWLLHANGMADTWLCKFCSIIWFPLFVVMRFVLIPVLVVVNYTLLPVDILVILAVFTLASVQFFLDALRSQLKGEWWEG